MQTVNIHQAKTNLSALLAKGKPFIIAKAGKPIANVTPIEPAESKRELLFGFMKGKGTVPDDFNEMFQEEIIAMFEGE